LGDAFGGVLLPRATRVRTAWEKTDFPRFYCCAGCAWACVGRPVKKAGSVCAKVELEVGGCCPGAMGLVQAGESHWGACALCTLWERGTASQPPETRLSRRSGPGADPQEEARERVLQQHSRASTWPRHDRTRFWHAEPVTLLGATATCRCNKGVRPLSQLRRCVLGAARRALLRARQLVLRLGGCCCLGLAQPHHVPLPSHALSLLAKTTVACNVVEAPVVPAHRGSRRPSHRPFPSSSRCFDCLATSSCPPTLPTAPALSLPLDTCLKTHLRHAG
jgi:hypothetical protein